MDNLIKYTLSHCLNKIKRRFLSSFFILNNCFFSIYSFLGYNKRGDNMLDEVSLNIFFNQELLNILVVCLIAIIFLYFFFYLMNYFFHKKIKKDIFYCTLITVLYAIVSLWNLGTTNFPTTYWQPVESNESIILTLEKDTQFNAILWISGEGDSNFNETNLQFEADFDILGSNDLLTWQEITIIDDHSYLQWGLNESVLWNYKYIKILSNSKNNVLHEIGFRNIENSGFLEVSIHSQSNENNPYIIENIIDEQSFLPLEFSYMNNTYFDEIYHARNAYEIAENQIMYESVHPLLGTSIMALFTNLWGANPWGFRIAGALFGILMLPLFYLILKQLFKQSRYASIGTALFAVEFMHYTTSRIATLEPFSVFFILLMYYFMIKYYCHSFYEISFKKTLHWLALSGITMGLAIATKWTGAYAAIGLAILFFTTLFQRYKEFLIAKKAQEKTAHQLYIIKVFKSYLWKTILWNCLFFVVVPLIIYFGSYLWIVLERNQSFNLMSVIEQTQYMLNYHIDLQSTHPFESPWYSWLVNIRPVWYYVERYNEEFISTISVMGNPLILWSGVLAITLCLYFLIKEKSMNAWLIIVAYFSQLVPWMLVSRCIFIYHYYPSIPFLILAIVFVIKELEKLYPRLKRYVNIYVLCCIFLFILFLPVISGFTSTNDYIDMLKWLPSWNFS